jgi:hypothetical protein
MEGELAVKKLTLILFVIIAVFSSDLTVLALETTTHKVINEYIANKTQRPTLD